MKFSPENSKIIIKGCLDPTFDVAAAVASATAGGKLAVLHAKRIAVKLSVIDEGVGISEDNIKQLFVPYTQFDAGALQKGGGTGVGLTICREIILLHGGKIGVNSKVQT